MSTYASPEFRPARAEAVSEICHNEIVGPPAAADVHPGSGGTYHVTVGIERVQESRLIETNIWLEPLQRVLAYEKGRLNSAIMTPKPHRTARAII